MGVTFSYHQSENNDRNIPAHKRPGYAAMAALVFESVKATNGPVDFDKIISGFSGSVEPSYPDSLRMAVDCLGRPETGTLGKQFSALIEQRGINLSHVGHDEDIDYYGYSPTTNTAWVKEGYSPETSASLLAGALCCAKSFYEGHGAAAKAIGEFNVGKEVSLTEIHAREEAASWAVAAHVASRLGVSPDKEWVPSQLEDSIEIYQNNAHHADAGTQLSKTMKSIEQDIIRERSAGIGEENDNVIAYGDGFHQEDQLRLHA